MGADLTLGVAPLYLLGANVCIRYLNGRAPGIRVRLRATPPDNVRVCSVVKAEMFAGPARSNDPARSRARQEALFAPFLSLPFDDDAARAYAPLRAHLPFLWYNNGAAGKAAIRPSRLSTPAFCRCH